MQVGPNWETLIERQIREAMDQGKFDDLPHHGKRLPNTDNPYAGEQALAFSVLKNYGAAPPWIEADKEVRDLIARRDALLSRAGAGPAPSRIAQRRDRAQLEELVKQINASIDRVNAEAPTYTVHRRRLRLDEELARYEAACARP